VSQKWKISSNDEQSHFVSNLGKPALKLSIKLKQNYGEHALSRSQVFKWYKTFPEGCESTKDEPCSGRPSTSKMDNNVVKM